jgi:guanine nucleotide-binding protein subunit gamma
LNNRLREDLERDRIAVSQAAKRCVSFAKRLNREIITTLTFCCSIISYTNSTKDFMVPSVWGTVDRREDPYAPQQSGGCCVVM